MSNNNRTLYRREFLDSMRLAQYYESRIPELARSLRVQALASLEQIRADERGMLIPNHTHLQALRAISWISLAHWNGHHPFQVIRLPEWARNERARPAQ